MRKIRFDGKGNILPPYIYWNKRARKYEVRAYINGKEVKVGRRFFSSLDKALDVQQKYITEHSND